MPRDQAAPWPAPARPATDWMEKVRVASPFYYYDSNRPLIDGIDWLNVLVLAAVSVLAALVAWWGFARRDVRM